MRTVDEAAGRGLQLQLAADRADPVGPQACLGIGRAAVGRPARVARDRNEAVAPSAPRRDAEDTAGQPFGDMGAGLDRLPVVVFTADVSARGEAPQELREGDVLITKPFQADDLLRAVQTAVNRP